MFWSEKEKKKAFETLVAIVTLIDHFAWSDSSKLSPNCSTLAFSPIILDCCEAGRVVLVSRKILIWQSYSINLFLIDSYIVGIKFKANLFKKWEACILSSHTSLIEVADIWLCDES